MGRFPSTTACLCGGLALLLAAAPPAHAARLVFNETGAASLLQDDTHLLRMRLGVFGPSWGYRSQDDATDVAPGNVANDSRTFSGTLAIPGTSDGEVLYLEEAVVLPTGALSFAVDTTLSSATSDVEVNNLNLSLFLDISEFAGTLLTTDAGTFELPPTFDGAAFQQWTTETLSLPLGNSGEVLEIGFSAPQAVLFQDNRAWSGSEYELRFILRDSGTVPSGTTDALDLEFAVTPALEVLLEPETVIHDTSGWAEFHPSWDAAPVEGSAVDIRSVLGNPSIPSSHLQAVEGKFATSDDPDTPWVFFGWNFTASANFPDHDEAEIVAERISRLGVNLVRHHHLDAPWSSPSLIDYSGDCKALDTDALDRLHYLIFQLRSHGVSSYLDLLVHREACDGLGIDAWADLPLGWKGYAIVDETLIALQKDYASRLLGAVNPYTGLTLAQDPAVVLLEVANENDLYSAEPTLEPYASALTARWEDWLANEGLPTSEPREGNTWRRFLSEIQAAYYQEMRTHLHSIGVQVPIAGTNWGTRPALLTANGQMDFTDSHAYWNHPRDGYIRFDNQPMVQTDRAVENTTLGLLAFSTLAGRPNFVSEWGHPWPNFTRAEGPLWMSATASLQGWDGMAHYTYRHRSGEVAALEGAFDAAIDPAAYALFPTAALLYRRGDITQSEDRTWVEVEAYSASPSKTAHTTSVGQRLTRTLLTGAPGLPAVTIENDDLVLDPATSALHGATEAGDALGQLRHDHLNGVVLIDTPRTQAALGLLGGAGPLALGDMTLEVEAATRFAVIAVTSLDGAPISEATRLLLTAVAQVENTGQTFLHDTSWVRDELGGAPILVEPVLAEVSLGRSLANAQAWRLDPLGNRLQEIELPADTIALADGGFSPWIEVLFHALDSGVETGEDEDTARDSGAPEGKDNAAGPCGCTARPTPGTLPLALLLLLMVRRNRVSSQSPANTGTNNSRPTS